MCPNKQTKDSSSNNGSVSSSSNSQSSESQAKEKLVSYVYEYLVHQGATRAAQTFLGEIHWDKNIPVAAEPPGFLYSWWCVFWDLYCSAPERRDDHNHSPEGKAFHDMNSGALPSPSYIPQPPTDMTNMSGMNNPSYYQQSQHSRPPSLSSSQASPMHPDTPPLPHQGGPQGMMHNPFINNRYQSRRPPNIRLPGQAMGPSGQSPFSNSMDPSQRHQQGGPYQTSSMMNAMQRMSHAMPPVPPNYNRIPPMSPMGVGPMGPSGMGMGPRVPWSHPNASAMAPGPPRTPILQSPQGNPSPQYGMEPPEPSMPMSDGPESLDGIPDVSTESMPIERIKESLKEEVKKFETERVEYYNMH